MTTYEYDTFFDDDSEIRLLTILPDSPPDLTICTLVHHDLDSLPSYEAVSYTWGDTSEEHPIQIDSYRLMVKGNAYGALIELRDPVVPRVLWIDAICIDQDDPIEKKHQVLLMNTIFAKAEKIVVWFPRPRLEDGLPVGLLRELHFHDFATSQKVQDENFERLPSSAWVALRDFLAHPWWSRVWTLQEVVLAREVVFRFGAHTVPWQFIAVLGSARNHLPNGRFCPKPDEAMLDDGLRLGHGQPPGRIAISTIGWMRSMLKLGRSFSLLDLLQHCWERRATDTRDCIYGLAGLCSDFEAGHLDLHPDYEAGVDAVLTNVVHNTLLRHGTLELFSKAGIGFPRTPSSLPSYVPDWYNLSIAAKPLHCLFDDGPRILPPEEKVISFNSLGKLEVGIYSLGTVLRTTTEPLSGIQDKQDRLKRLTWFYEAELMARGGVLNGVNDPYPMLAPLQGSEAVFEAFWRTLVANRSIHGSKPSSSWVHGYQRYKQTLSRACGYPMVSLFVDVDEHRDRYDDPADDTAAVMKSWVDAMLVTSYGRSFCVTDNGRMGLVPPETEPGDQLCLVVGGAVPFVLRPTLTVFSDWQLVGECYLHGVDALATIKAWNSDPLMETQKVTLV